MDKIRILVVDDEEQNLKVINYLLRNYKTTTEKSALKSVELIKKNKYDIYIIDYIMPDMDGLNLLKKIQSFCKKEKYICIFCTAVGTSYMFQEEKKAGLFTYILEKPYDISQFTELIKKVVVELGGR